MEKANVGKDTRSDQFAKTNQEGHDRTFEERRLHFYKPNHPQRWDQVCWDDSRGPRLVIWHRGLKPWEALSDCLFIVRVAGSCSPLTCRGLRVVWVEWNSRSEDWWERDINGRMYGWMDRPRRGRGVEWMSVYMAAGQHEALQDRGCFK